MGVLTELSFAKRLTATCSALAMAAIAIPGAAVAAPSVFATQTYTLGGTTNTVTDSTVADVLPYYNVGTDSVFGHSYAYPSGTNGSRSSGTNNFSINGASTFEQFFTNNTGVAETLIIPFEIANGEVATSMSGSTSGFQSSGVRALITLNGATAFDYKADMTLSSNGSGGSAMTLSVTGPQLGGDPTPYNNTSSLSGDYSWAPYDSVVSIVLQPTETVDFLYRIESYANGTIGSLGDCGGTGIGGAPPANNGGYGANLAKTAVVVGNGGYGGSTSCYNSAIGRIGDPFNPDTVPQGVPEPTSLAVLGAGLAGLAFNRRRRPAA